MEIRRDALLKRLMYLRHNGMIKVITKKEWKKRYFLSLLFVL